MLDPSSKAGQKVTGKRSEHVKDDLSFGDWYNSLESGLLEASHDEYRYESIDSREMHDLTLRHRRYLDQLKSTEDYLGNLSADTAAALNILSSLAQSFNTVETQTTAFQKQCEDLMMEQKRLENLATKVGENIQYYSYLEPITRKLNAPGAGNFVRGKEFSDMLARLDECLEYMNGHVCVS